MTTYITSGVYATSFSTRTRNGETYYWVYGWRLGRQVYRESATDFDGSSKDPLETIGWCDYISESAYNTLSVVMREAFDASSHKVAKDGALTKIPSGDPGYFRFGLVSDMVYDVPIGLCKDVVCKPICIGADKYSQKCVTEGPDAGTCVFDKLIEENSPDCGYVPPEEKVCDEGSKRGKVTCWNGSIVHKEVCINNEWVPTNETCPEKPHEEDDDIHDLLDTIGISKEHAIAAILIIIVIIILRRLL